MQSILLYTADAAAAKAEIEAFQGKVNQQFTPELLVADLPEEVDPQTLSSATTDIPSDLSTASQLAFNAWNRVHQKQFRADASPDFREGLPWDTEGFQEPKSLAAIHHPDKEGGIERSTGTPTSEYLIGSVAVGVVIVSGPGGFAISEAEAELVLSEIQEGLQFLAKEELRAKVSFVYDLHVLTVDVAPGDTSDYEAAEAPWRDAALGKMSYAPSRQGSIDYVTQLRQLKRTDWAYVAYFTKYPLHHFAYAIDEKLVMSYDNDGWGTQNINRVFAHETCHIFGAADEYGNCSCRSFHGYLSIANGNCRRCAPSSVNCLMDRNELVLCDWTKKQIGWDDRMFPLPSPGRIS